MKKKLLLTILLLAPFIIEAKMKNDFDHSASYANYFAYEISNHSYSSFSMLCVYDFRDDSSTNNNVPFRYENGVLSGEEYFYGGGLLNFDEFNISKDRQGNTYLHNGNDYWTMTTDGNKAYKITNTTAKQTILEDMSSTSGTRVTEYLREVDELDYTYLLGSGSYVDPWYYYAPPR